MKRVIFGCLGLCLLILSCEVSGTLQNIDSQTIGQGGSLARFTIVGDYLYMIDKASISWFDLRDPSGPDLQGTVETLGGQETIFPFQDFLYVGRFDGVSLFAIEPGTGKPLTFRAFPHFVACDPVVANEDYIFSTVRTSFCIRPIFNLNQVETVEEMIDYDAKDMSNNLTLLKIVEEEHNGMGVRDSFLFVTQGSVGMTIFKVEEPLSLSFVNNIPMENPRDIIIRDDYLILVGLNEMVLYDYEPLRNGQDTLRRLSSITTR